MGYSPRGHTESDTTEQLSPSHVYSITIKGESSALEQLLFSCEVSEHSHARCLTL